MNKFYFLLFYLLLLASCKTATKAYDKGNYKDALELAVKRLQKNPSDGETKALAQNAYRQAVNDLEHSIRLLTGSTAENRYEALYNEYRQLQQLTDFIRQSPALNTIIRTEDYSDYIATYRNKAAEEHYEKGMDLMEERDKRAYRQAYQSFKSALRFTPSNEAIRKKMEEAYKLALVTVVVLPMDDVMGGYRYSSSYELRNFENELVRNLRYQTNNEFVQFLSEWEARGKDIEPDEILELQLGRIEIGRPYDQQHTRNVSKEVVVKEVVYKPDSVVKQYATVHAQITTVRRTMVSGGELFVTARDTKGRVLWNDLFRGEHRWQTEFATYRGDNRALSDHDRSLLNRYDNNIPREEQILNEVLRQIEQDINYRIRNYYNRYS